MRNILAVIAGIITASIIIYLIESLGHMAYPLPEGLDFNNPEVVNSYIDSAPFGALLFVLIAYFLGGMAGGYATARIAKSKKLNMVGITGAILFIFTAINVYLIPQPLWFSIAAFLVIILGVYLGSRLAIRLTHNRDLTPS